MAAAGVVVTALAVGGSCRAWRGFSAGGPAPAPSAVHVVVPGDSLWELGRRLQPEGDVRPVVDRLVEANGTAAPVVGQRLALEAAGGGSDERR
ncbi:MAG: hypothetical protein ACKVWR_12675 [Acidimicrobiales bacterium]